MILADTEQKLSPSAPALYEAFLARFAAGDYETAAALGEQLAQIRYAPAIDHVFGLSGACFRSGRHDLALRLAHSLLAVVPNFRPALEIVSKITGDRIYRTTDNPVVPAVQVAAYRVFASHCAGGTVIDVGCGLGLGTQILTRSGARVVATDIEGTALHYARETYPVDAGYVQGSATHLPFASRSFDFVTCVDVIEHIPDYGRALEEMKRVARRGVLISTPNRLPENTNPDGTPRNYWHVFEWSPEQICAVLAKHFREFDLNFLCGDGDRPYFSRVRRADKIQALVVIAYSGSMPDEST